ncbi:putative Ribosome recycling factor domain-containing protein [Seiridium cardinale]|uniref:Ribosome recycling factor domain-containing protein n=1 Tax=Seiridium cardinale TaxID=138064 RepID=A0ABR2XUK2_9PEZI
MRGTTTTTTLLRSSRALCELRGITPAAVRPAASSLRVAASSSQYFALPQRPLHTTVPCLKKARGDKDSQGASSKDKQAERREKTKSKGGDHSASASASASSASSSQHPTPNPEEPLDFADVQSRLAKASESPLETLKKLKTGGRFNPDLIGAVRVQPDKQDGASYPLRELAQVVPKGGRTISILVHEADSIKPILSAIQAHKDFNQQPQRDPDNELELVLKLELEKREDVVKRVKAVCHEWKERVRQVRQKRDKVHAAWKKDGAMLPDIKRKADTELDKLIKAKVSEIDAAEKEALKAAEGK